MFSSAAKRSDAAFASSSIPASFPASRWRWSSSCSAVSTTEVTIPGLQTTPPLVQTAPSPVSRGDPADLERELRGAGERIASPVHRRRAGVRGLAGPGDQVTLDPEGAEHHAQREVERLEHRPLLDVQLEVGGRVLELPPLHRSRGRGRRRTRSRASASANAVRDRCSSRSSSWSAIEPAAALEPNSDRPKRAPSSSAQLTRRTVSGGVPSSCEPPQHLDARHHVQAAVEPAAVRHRVDVTADQERAFGVAAEGEPLVPGLVHLVLGERRPSPAATRARAPTSPSRRRAAHRSRRR